MKQFPKRILCLLVVLSLIFSLLPAVFAAPSAEKIVTTASGYDSADDVVYDTSSGYIANWGARGEGCVFLSTYAQDFYANDTYAELSALSGGTSTSDAADSALYGALQELMVSNHTTFTKYGGTTAMDCKKLYQYTDCMLGDTSYVSTIYRGLTVGGAWDGGVSYNQEHIWPQSKCIGTASTDIGDIMQLRPANPSENSSRNNTAYGESEGYYDPGVSVRGDCARTLLYMYTRWGNTTYMWGADGVIESVDVLLRWIREDPVDTWEMGHNDAVQSITGTRNVFVDYPEYAYLLFGEAIPADLSTPSDPAGSGGTAQLVTDGSTLGAGDEIIIVASGYDYALSTEQKTSNRGQAAITRSADGATVTYGADAQILTLQTGNISGTFGLYTGESYLYASSSTANQLKSETALSDNSSWSITVGTDGIASVVANGTNNRKVLRYNSTSGLFACYAEGTTQKELMIYRIVEEEDPGTSGQSQTATLVTNGSSLKAGDQIIIVASGYDDALSTEQKTSNRGQAAVVRSEDGTTVTFGSDAQILTLQTGTVSGTFGLYTGEGYLYASSSSANQLRSETTLSDNSSWSITVGTDGIASLTASGTNTRNVLRYNSSSGLFSCYDAVNSQKDVMIYRIGAGGDSGGTEEEEGIKLVTDGSSLKAGDQIIIVASGYDYALSDVQNTSNRGQAAIVRGEDGSVLSYGSAVQILTLQTGTVSGTFGLYTGDGYLYASSSSSNQLKTEAALSANSSWTISIGSDGIASIVANGTYSRNVLRYNSTSGLFSCYDAVNSQKDVMIYYVGTGGDTGSDEGGDSGGGTTDTCNHDWSQGYCTRCGQAYVLIVTAPTGYTSASDVVYATVSGYVTNWGARGEECVFLSGYAQDYYTSDISYGVLSALDGGTSSSDAPQSPLYSALQTMMVDRHTTLTKYSTASSALDSRYYYQYTDCMKNDTTYVSTYYRGDIVGGTWDGGVSYNQEHVWPKSKCIGDKDTDIGDLMHLRPAIPSENSSRNNTAYGEGEGYYDPGLSVRGDCARTLLYLYTRWGNTTYMWGTEGAIESMDILLKWMEEDPVDTWEMGRNDSVQSITGVRNVFVDYPEYAFLLFGEEIPADMQTPTSDAEPAVQPTLTMKYPSLSFEAEILYNVYYIAENTEDVVEMGLATFDTERTDGTLANATEVIPGFVTDGSLWKVGTNGISAKNLGDTLYFKVYARLTDGSCVYSAMKSYSAISYAKTILDRATSSNYMKALVVAMLNYGTEAQLYFGHDTDTLMNASLTAAQQALVGAYDESMVDPVVAVDTVKAKGFLYDGSSFTRRAPTVSFDGAFAINYYFTGAKAADDGMTLYYWNIEDYNAATTLTVDNATGSMEMLDTGVTNQFWGEVPGIAAKELDRTIFVAGVYECNGVTYTTGILNYSIGKYCEGLAAKDTSDQQAFAQATAVYGFCAKEYFANT